jgi:hypothetical protein
MNVKEITLTLPFRTTYDIETGNGYTHFRIGGCDVSDNDDNLIGRISAAITGGVFIKLDGGEEYYLDPRDLWYAFTTFLENGESIVIEDPYHESIEPPNEQKKINRKKLSKKLTVPRPEDSQPDPPTKVAGKLSRVVYLHISTWVGTAAIGAIHYFGELQCGDQVVKVTRVLSKPQAEKLNKEARRIKPRSDYELYRPDQETEDFLSRKEVRERALEIWKEHFPNADILVEGRRSVADPQQILIGPPHIMSRVNHWVYEAEAIGWYDGGHKKEMDEIFNEFSQFWKTIDKTNDE